MRYLKDDPCYGTVHGLSFYALNISLSREVKFIKYYALDMWSGQKAFYYNFNKIFVDFTVLFHCLSRKKSNYKVDVRQD
jgi:hypothetical protein